jgi:hypothetical protein
MLADTVGVPLGLDDADTLAVTVTVGVSVGDCVALAVELAAALTVGLVDTATHVVPSGELVVSGGQGSHAAAPAAGATKPATHATHAPAPLAPATALAVPAGHSVHAVNWSLYVPGGHGAPHAAEPGGVSEPAAHGAQSPEAAGAAVPAGHCDAEHDPSGHEYPAGHGASTKIAVPPYMMRRQPPPKQPVGQV